MKRLKKIIIVILLGMLTLSLGFSVSYAKSNKSESKEEKKENKQDKKEDKQEEKEDKYKNNDDDCKPGKNGVGNAYGRCKDRDEDWEDKDDYEKAKSIVNDTVDIMNKMK